MPMYICHSFIQYSNRNTFRLNWNAVFRNFAICYLLKGKLLPRNILANELIKYVMIILLFLKLYLFIVATCKRNIFLNCSIE